MSRRPKKKEPMPVSDGRKAILPHPLLQSVIFSVARREYGGEGLASMIIERRNAWGDSISISSPRPLLARPDMGVFLAVTALVQKNGFEPLVGQESEKYSGKIWSRVPLSELYDLTGMRRSRSREALFESLEALGGTSIVVRYADRKRHGGAAGVALSSFWDFKLIPRRGRGGSVIDFFPADFLIPRKYYLWADAGICNSLRQDTARAIFWALLCREHFAGTIAEWQQLVGGGDSNPWRWRDKRFLPALEELATKGYKIQDKDGIYVISRPKKEALGGS